MKPNQTCEPLTVATAIAEQIGGRAFLMMGTRHKIRDGKSLTFDVRGSRRANRVKVTLDDDDTYTVNCYSVRGIQEMLTSSFTGIYSNQLKGILETGTGLALSL